MLIWTKNSLSYESHDSENLVPEMRISWSQTKFENRPDPHLNQLLLPMFSRLTVILNGPWSCPRQDGMQSIDLWPAAVGRGWRAIARQPIAPCPQLPRPLFSACMAEVSVPDLNSPFSIYLSVFRMMLRRPPPQTHVDTPCRSLGLCVLLGRIILQGHG